MVFKIKRYNQNFSCAFHKIVDPGNARPETVTAANCCTKSTYLRNAGLRYEVINQRGYPIFLSSLRHENAFFDG